MQSTFIKSLNALFAPILFGWLLAVSCAPDPDPYRNMFAQFSDSVAGNTNLPKIVSWARNVLADTNHFSILERTRIDKKELPKDLYHLYHGPNADVVTPDATIVSLHETNRFVAVSYLPGSVFIFSLFIGGEDFSLPPDSVKKWKKLEAGVFVSLDWVGR